MDDMLASAAIATLAALLTGTSAALAYLWQRRADTDEGRRRRA